MNILGVNAYHADAAAALVMDGQLVAAASEERFNRQKHCSGFPSLAIEYCLREGGLKLSQLDHVGVSRKPWANLSKKLWHVASKGLWLQQNAWKSAASTASVGALRSKFARVWENGLAPKTRLHCLEHHITHAASAFFVSGFERSAILTLDGFGDFCSGILAIGEGNRIKVLRRIYFPHSLGVYYTALTQYLGFPHFGDEGKVMALASFGKPHYLREMSHLLQYDRSNLIQLGLDYFTHHVRGVEMTWAQGSPSLGTLYSGKLLRLLGPARHPEEPFTERFYDIACSMQKHLEEVILQLVNDLARTTKEKILCLAGGVALNSVVNGRIRQETPFHEIFIQPAAADDGTAIGCAFHIEHQLLNKPRTFVMHHANWGPSYSEESILSAIEKFSLRSQRVDNPEDFAAEAISTGKVIGWFQGRMEFGPRALGNRSILADARNMEMKLILNERIKHRETFRPFAPSILEETAPSYFDQDYPSPFMLLVYKARPEQAHNIPGALHVDQTGRVQTVNPQQNTLYYRLLKKLQEITGHGIVINTSFNDSEPIVCTPEDAIHCFLHTKMDLLFLGNHMIVR